MNFLPLILALLVTCSFSESISDKDVIVLDDSNFDSQVLNSQNLWFVEFYAPWCGHCKNLEPEWNLAAKELKGKVKVAKVDATANTRLSSKYEVKGYPTIKIFPPKSSSPQDYNVVLLQREQGNQGLLFKRHRT